VTDADDAGWSPRWLPAPEQLDLQRSRLLALRGHRVVETWLAWMVDQDSWFADLPVVLRIDDGRQLEVSWQKFDELSITWSTVDVSSGPGVGTTWRSRAHDALRAVTGRTIVAVSRTEHLCSTPEADHDTWLVSGLWLQMDHGALHVFDALDENGLENDLGDAAATRLRPL
jgi:hypothetical protein